MRKRFSRLSLAVFLVAACGSSQDTDTTTQEPIAVQPTQPEPPPATEAPAVPDEPPAEEVKKPLTAGQINWYSLHFPEGTNLDKVEPFYAAVFPWTFKNRHAYLANGSMVAHLAQSDASKPRSWSLWMTTEDLDRVNQAITELGAKKLHQADRGFVHQILAEDPGGLHAYAAKPPKPAVSPYPDQVIPGTQGWAEIWVKDAAAVEARAAFYEKYYGLERAGGLLSMFGTPVLEVRIAPAPKHDNRYVPYVVVADLDATLAAVKKAKGKVVAPPTDTERGRVAAFDDPNGITIGAIQRPAVEE